VSVGDPLHSQHRMDQSGLSSRAVADQLGHASTSMTTDAYFGRKVATTGAAAVLEALDT
jgi:integrase